MKALLERWKSGEATLELAARRRRVTERTRRVINLRPSQALERSLEFSGRWSGGERRTQEFPKEIK
jgi:hypothetical protein